MLIPCMLWVELLILCLMLTCATCRAQEIPTRIEPSESNFLLLEVRLDNHLLSDSMTAHESGRHVFLPLGELCRLLTIAIRTTPADGIASGYVLQEDRPFSLSLPRRIVTVKDKDEPVDPALIKIQPDDIYVASELISRWLPLDLDIDLSALSLQVRSRELLPVQARLQREQRQARLGQKVEYIAPGYPRTASAYKLADVPFVDQTISMSMERRSGRMQADTRYVAYLASDFGGMESTLYATRSQHDADMQFRFALGRNDPDAGLWGPLQARSFGVGNIEAPGVANIARGSLGTGVKISNSRFTRPTSFDRHTLQGDLPPGWDVELYYNDALVDSMESSANGQYLFADQPLNFGPNEFRLVFHGPLGQLRVERHNFLLDQSATVPGEFYYSFLQQQDKTGGKRSIAQFDWGVDRHLSAAGRFIELPMMDKVRRYGTLGLRSFWETVIFNGDLTRSADGGSLMEIGAKTRIAGVAATASRIRFKDFVSELLLAGPDPLRTRDLLRIDGSIPTPTAMRMPAVLEFKRDITQSGRTTNEIAGRVSSYIKGTALTKQLRWFASGGQRSASGSLQVSRRFGEIGLRGQLNYSAHPQRKLSDISIFGDKNLTEGYLLTTGMTRLFSSSDTQLSMSLNKSLGNYGMRVNAGYSSRGNITIGIQLFLAMGREPRQSAWLFDSQPMVDKGSASLRVFLDKNLNGAVDSDDEPLKNVGFLVNGSKHPARTNADGIVVLNRLPVKQQVDIAIDLSTLEDPQWMSQLKGASLVPRPGRVNELDFPIITSGEIDGTVHVAGKGGAKRGLGDIRLELVDGKDNVIATSASGPDGFYIFSSVPPGTYVLRVLPAQLRQIKMTEAEPRSVTLSADGSFLNGVDILLVP